MSNQPVQPVTVHIQTGTGEILRIVATILLFGGLGLGVWTVAQGPAAMYASVAATAGLVFFTRQLWGRQLIGLPTTATAVPTDAVRGVAAASSNVASGWLRRISVPLLLLVSVGYGIAFLAVREVFAALLTVPFGQVTANYASIAVTAAVVFLAGRLIGRQVGAAPAAPVSWADAVAGRGLDATYLIATAKWAASNATAYLYRCNIVVLALVSAGYGIVFLGVRQAVSIGLHVFENLYMATTVALILGSVLVLPSLVPSMGAALRRAGVIRPTQPAEAPAQQPAPASSPTPAPVVQQPVAPAPAPAPARKVVRRVRRVEQPAPTPTPKKAVRVVKKKENTDV
ncbi:hypothetical protein ND991_17970 [Gordonia sputi]|uniref:hypothetical protein n=1 Tax=Gordonia sputi TaxID=36823 RepID=UPI002042DA70|nr:hypothetical protein [Gordonia sputi]MCM3897096.1 hypothetical protein [Gordonia sputi]